MIQNIKHLVTNIKGFCVSHKQINSYYHGDVVEVLRGNTEIVYTTMITSVTNAVVNPFDITVTLNIMVLDKILRDRINKLEVESNTLLVLGDFVNYVQSNNDIFRYARIVGSPTAVKIEDKAFDVVDGWQCTAQFKLRKLNGLCEMPLN